MQILENTIAYDPSSNKIVGAVTFAPMPESGMANFMVPMPDLTIKQWAGTVDVIAEGDGPAGLVGVVWSAQLLNGVEGDTNMDGVVDGTDLGMMLAAFTAMDGAKIGMLLSNFGQIEKLLQSVSGSMTGVGLMSGQAIFQGAPEPAVAPNGRLRVKCTISKATKLTFKFDLQV
jgi:hypothetical protein